MDFELNLGYVCIYLLAAVFGIFLIFIFLMMYKDYQSIGRSNTDRGRDIVTSDHSAAITIFSKTASGTAPVLRTCSDSEVELHCKTRQQRKH